MIKRIRSFMHNSVDGYKVFASCVLFVAFNIVATLYFKSFFDDNIILILSTEYFVIEIFKRHTEHKKQLRVG